MIGVVVAVAMQAAVACPSVVSVAIVEGLGHSDAATALQSTFATWDCVRVVHIEYTPVQDKFVDVAALDIAKARDVDWVVVVGGDASLVQARLVDPALRDVLVRTHGPADEVAMDLMAPISKELTLSRVGGSRIAVVVTGITYRELGQIEQYIKAIKGVEDAGAPRFKNGTAEIVVRTNGSRASLLAGLRAIKHNGRLPRIVDDRLRRVELTWKPAPSVTPAAP
jgi:hypothetical protein